MACEWFRSGRKRQQEKAQPPQPIHVPTAHPSNPIRITDPFDGELLPRMYSYWSSACRLNGVTYVFVPHGDLHPKFFKVEGGISTRLGALIAYTATGEGWYWDAEGWIYLCTGPFLRRVNPFTGEDRIVVDISVTFPGCDLWQTHSSDDGRTHSATIRQPTESGPYIKLGSAVFRDGGLLRFETPTLGELDECAISGNGRFWLVKESQDDDNRLFDLETGTERVIHKADGALGHSDMGPDWAIGDDRTVGGASWVNLANPDDRRVLVRFPDWNMGHVSVRAGRCLLTHGGLLTLPDVQTGAVRVLAPHGMVGSDYDQQVQGNLDPTGTVAVFMSNMGTDRQDVYLLELPT